MLITSESLFKILKGFLNNTILKKSQKCVIFKNTKMTKQNNFITLKIELTETTIQVAVINKQKEEEFIHLNSNNLNIYPLNIEFNNNEIIYCQQETNENTITNFVQELFANPTEYKKYSFTYQNKEYNVLAETLLILIINEFKNKVD